MPKSPSDPGKNGAVEVLMDCFPSSSPCHPPPLGAPCAYGSGHDGLYALGREPPCAYETDHDGCCACGTLEHYCACDAPWCEYAHETDERHLACGTHEARYACGTHKCRCTCGIHELQHVSGTRDCQQACGTDPPVELQSLLPVDWEGQLHPLVIPPPLHQWWPVGKAAIGTDTDAADLPKKKVKHSTHWGGVESVVESHTVEHHTVEDCIVVEHHTVEVCVVEHQSVGPHTVEGHMLLATASVHNSDSRPGCLAD